MIVKMQKVTLMCVAHDRAATLESLRGLGVLHVKPVVPPTGAGLEQAREKGGGFGHLDYNILGGAAGNGAEGAAQKLDAGCHHTEHHGAGVESPFGIPLANGH